MANKEQARGGEACASRIAQLGNLAEGDLRASHISDLSGFPSDPRPAMSLSTPTQDDLEELLLSCRYGDVDDIQQVVSKFGPDALATARDDNGNTVLHMVAGNGHTGIVVISRSLVSPGPQRRETVD